jgi:para-aminobenzoate synthetase/4-amino-4-deoxychorismate lyase
MRHKIRILLDEQGQFIVETAPLETGANIAQMPLRIDMAVYPISSQNVFLYHKTTHRVVYEQARASRPNCDEVLLWNERGEITEATIANVAVCFDGKWLTPPVESGLLAGTYRQRLLAKGEIEEQIIKLADLPRAKEIWLFNSVQRWRRAELVEQLTEAPKPFVVPQ